MSLALLKATLYKKALDSKKACLETETAIQSNLCIQFEDDEKVCRICCEEGDIHIFSELYDNTIAHYINMCSEIIVSSSDGFPKWLCGSCLKLLKCCIQFRELTQRSASTLIKIKMKQRESAEVPVKYETDYKEFDATSPLCPPSPPAEGAVEGAEWKGVVEGAEWSGGAMGWEDVVPSCESCSRDFNNIIEYRDHLAACNQTLLSGDAKHAAINRKTRKKIPKGPFLCEICGKSLGKLHSLVVHRTTHRNIFPFKCDKCEYRGRTKDLLKVHMRTHLAVRPFACPKCPLRFITASNLGKHRLRHEEQKPQECPQCGKTFSNKISVTRHMTDIHVSTPPVHCDLCGKRFSRQKTLHKHRIKAHNMKSERTGRWPSYLLCDVEENESDSFRDPHEPNTIMEQ